MLQCGIWTEKKKPFVVGVVGFSQLLYDFNAP